jgi:hypothetical protein
MEDSTQTQETSTQNAPSQDKQATTKKITRRSFLKKLGAIGGMLTAEATLNPLEKVTDWLASTDRIPEGALDQRIVIMKKITRDLVTARTPEDKEKAKSVLWAWLKFNGAQAYAQEQGYEITNDFLKHFLLDYNFAIDDLEGKLLADTGYGHEFDVEGAFSLQTPVVVDIPRDLIPH